MGFPSASRRGADRRRRIAVMLPWLKWPGLAAVFLLTGLAYLRIYRVHAAYEAQHRLRTLFTQQSYNHSVPQKALVVASYLDQDVSWLLEIPKDWGIYRYINDYDHDREFDAAPHGLPVTKAKHFPSRHKGQGREVNAYLTFIVENYDRLPEFMVFLHGHNQSWHQPEYAVDKVRALNLSSVQDQGFISLKCQFDTMCIHSFDLSGGPAHVVQERSLLKLFPAVWKWAFEGQPEADSPTPELANQGQAQFAVTREAVRSRPLAFWEHLREPLMHNLHNFTEQLKNISRDTWDDYPATEDEWDLWDGVEVTNRGIGFTFEKFWNVLFGRPGKDCPAEDFCWKHYFGGVFRCEIFKERPEQKWQVHHTCTVNRTNLKRMDRENKRFLRGLRDGNG